MDNTYLFILVVFVSSGFTGRISRNQEPGLWDTLDGKPSLLMGHRGEKVFMPEHTIGSYEIASIEKADYVEPDLVLTKDDHLVCFHDLTITDGTDVKNHLGFEHLKRNWTLELDGKNQTFVNEWFIADFKLEELRNLTVIQKPVGIRPQLFNQLFKIPTFEEYLDVVHKMSYKQNRTIGVIPEIKHPKFHNENRSLHYMEDKVLEVFAKYGYPIRKGDTQSCNYTDENGIHPITCSQVIIQSFEFDSLPYLKNKTDMELLMLADSNNLRHLTFEGLKEVAGVAQHLSVWKELLYTGVEAEIKFLNISYDKEEIESLGGFIPAKDFVREAHRLGLKMGLFTIYDSHEISYRGCTVKCDEQDKQKELFYYFEMGVDGIFVENVQEAIEIRMEYDEMLQKRLLESDIETLNTELEKEQKSVANLTLQNEFLESDIENLKAELEKARNSVTNLIPTKFSVFSVILFAAFSWL